jgi:hypothetical protein
MLIMAKRWGFARGAHGNETMRPLRDLPFDQAAKRRLVDGVALHRRNQCGDGTFNAVVERRHDGTLVNARGP